MELSFTYVLSQIFTIIMFILLGYSYHVNKRKEVLLLNIFAQVFQNLSMILLHGFTGAVMSLVMLLSYIIIYIRYIKNRKVKKKENICTMILLFSLILIAGIITFDGYASILAIIATLIILTSVWQESMNNYRIIGVIGSFFWLLYYNHLESIFGVILETLLIINTIISYINSKKKMSKN